MIVKASLFLSTGAIEQTYGTGRLDHLGGLRTREPLITVAFVIAALSLAGLPPFSGFVAKFSLILASIEAGALAVGLIALVVSLFTLLSMLKIWAAVFNGKRSAQIEHYAAEARVRERENLLDDELVDESTVADEAALAIEHNDPPRGATTIEEDPHDHRGTRIPTALAVPSLILAAITVSLGLGAEFLLELSAQAAAGLLDTTAYVQAVLGR
jgi:multicomponent Na+:H+ antiporter subunit D